MSLTNEKNRIEDKNKCVLRCFVSRIAYKRVGSVYSDQTLSCILSRSTSQLPKDGTVEVLYYFKIALKYM